VKVGGLTFRVWGLMSIDIFKDLGFGVKGLWFEVLGMGLGV